MTYILWLLICCYMSWATFHAMLELLFGIPECQGVAPCSEILELWTFKKWWLTWCDVTGLVLEILCICTFTSLIRSQEWSSSKTSLRRSETSSATGEDIFYDCGEVIKNKIMCLNSLLIGLWKCCHWNGPCWNKNKQKVKVEKLSRKISTNRMIGFMWRLFHHQKVFCTKLMLTKSEVFFNLGLCLSQWRSMRKIFFTTSDMKTIYKIMTVQMKHLFAAVVHMRSSYLKISTSECIISGAEQLCSCPASNQQKSLRSSTNIQVDRCEGLWLFCGQLGCAKVT